ncbi:MAG: hypothetical protein R2860_08665 [Desulfobacterales bacterium]
MGFLVCRIRISVLQRKIGTPDGIEQDSGICGSGLLAFPCKCGSYPEIIPHMQDLCHCSVFDPGNFCNGFAGAPGAKNHRQARIRACIYGICGITIVASILIIAIDIHLNGIISSQTSRVIFYSENAALVSLELHGSVRAKCFRLSQTTVMKRNMPVPSFDRLAKRNVHNKW